MYRELKKNKALHQNHASCDFQQSVILQTANLGNRQFKLINKLCGKDLSMIKVMRNSSMSTLSPHKKKDLLERYSQNPEYIKEIEACAEKVAAFSGLDVTLHEFGHNMSMFHNFEASADKENFLPVEEFNHNNIFKPYSKEEKGEIIKTLVPVSSSVMDYVINSPRLTPGGYDLAFIQFIYGGELETVKTSKGVDRDARFIKLEDSLNWETNVLDRGERIKQYKVCNDADVFRSKSIYCNRWDLGTTPFEIVQHYKSVLIDDVLTDSYSDINPSSYSSNRWYNVVAFFHNTKSIYHKWRLRLRKKLKIDNDSLFLTDINVEDYNNKIQALAKEDKSFENFYLAKSTIFHTFYQLLFAKNHYCIVANTNKSLTEWIPFSQVHSYLADYTKVKVRQLDYISSCKDMSTSFSRSGFTFLGEVGISLFPGRFATDKYFERQFPYKFDYDGIYLMRLLSGIFLTSRSYSPVTVDDFKFQSLGMLDEPDNNNFLRGKFLSRVTRGIDERELKKNDAKANLISALAPNRPPSVFIQNFSDEELLLKFMGFSFAIKNYSPDNQLLRSQSLISSLALMNPINVDAGSFDLIHIRPFIYNQIQREGGYLIDENKELNSQGRPTLGIFNVSQSGYLHRLVDSLRTIDLRKSLFTFSGKLNEKSEKFKKSKFVEKEKFILGTIEELKRTTEFLHKSYGSFVSLLTFSLIYDYLEAGILPDKSANNGYITQQFVQILQAGAFLKFYIKDAFKKKCKLEGINEQLCPDTYLTVNPSIKKLLKSESKENENTSDREELDEERRAIFDLLIKDEIKKMEFNYLDVADFLFLGGEEGEGEEEEKEKRFVSNVFKPYFKNMISYICDKDFSSAENTKEGKEKNQELSLDCIQKAFDNSNDEDKSEAIKARLKSMSQLIFELYTMDLFRPAPYATSGVSQGLEQLLTFVKRVIDRDQRGFVETRVVKLKSNIISLRRLEDYPNNKFFQEMFFRNPFFYSPNQESTMQVFLSILKAGAIPFVQLKGLLRHILKEQAIRTSEEFSSKDGVLEKHLHERSFSDEKLVEILSETIYSSVALISDRISYDETHGKIINSLRLSFADISKASIGTVLVAIDGRKVEGPVEGGFKYFLNLNSIGEESGPLYELFRNRILLELDSQANVVVSSMLPLLSINNQSFLGGGRFGLNQSRREGDGEKPNSEYDFNQYFLQSPELYNNKLYNKAFQFPTLEDYSEGHAN